MTQRIYPQVWSAFYSTPWAIMPGKLDEIEAAMLAILAARADGKPSAFQFGEEVEQPKASDRGDIALIPVRGTITPRASAFSSGGSTADQIGRNGDKAAADPGIRNIVLDIDSPGGSVHGIEELAAKIRNWRAIKPVTAVANHNAHSAGYWIGSQATNFVVSPSAAGGNIGVIYKRADASAAFEKEGVKVNLITAGKFKGEGAPYSPMTDAEAENLQGMANTYYDKFITDVAAGRRTNKAHVENHFGQGRAVLAEDMVKRGMADRVATLETVLSEMRGAGNRMRQAAAKRTMLVGA